MNWLVFGIAVFLAFWIFTWISVFAAVANTSPPPGIARDHPYSNKEHFVYSGVLTLVITTIVSAGIFSSYNCLALAFAISDEPPPVVTAWDDDFLDQEPVKTEAKYEPKESEETKETLSSEEQVNTKGMNILYVHLRYQLKGGVNDGRCFAKATVPVNKPVPLSLFKMAVRQTAPSFEVYNPETKQMDLYKYSHIVSRYPEHIVIYKLETND